MAEGLPVSTFRAQHFVKAKRISFSWGVLARSAAACSGAIVNNLCLRHSGNRLLLNV